MADTLRLQVILDLVDRAGAKLRAITGGSHTADKAMAALQDRLRGLQAQQQQIARHRVDPRVRGGDNLTR